jgi:hypothetical protein
LGNRGLGLNVFSDAFCIEDRGKAAFRVAGAGILIAC